MLAEAPHISCLNHFPTSSLVFTGTAGSRPPVNLESTGGAVIFNNVQEKQTEKILFAEEIDNLLINFNLGKDQLSKILGITRPTLDKWLKSDKEVRLIEVNRHRLHAIKAALNEIEKSGYATSLGPMLRKRLDEDCCRLYDALVSENLNTDKINSAIKQAKYRFIGQKNALRLDNLLSNSEPLA